MTIAADVAFARIAGLDAAKGFTGYGPLPAITTVAGATVWASVGQQRTLYLADGSSLVETLVEFDPPRSFAYRADQYSSVFRFLVKGGRGHWRFSPDGAGGCSMRWNYRHIPRHWLAAPLLWAITHTLWRAYMRRSMARCAAIIAD